MYGQLYKKSFLTNDTPAGVGCIGSILCNMQLLRNFLCYKKIISLFIAVILVFGIITVSAADTAIQNEEDEQLNLLTALGIIPADNNIDSQSFVKRSEIAIYIGRLLHVDKLNYSSDKIFNDISDNDECYNGVMNLYKMGVISGDEAGNFNPESAASFSEAVKMLVASLNYGAYTEQYGGYPFGYYSVAQNIGLFKNVEVSENLTGNMMVQMLYNALNTKYVETSVEDGNMNFEPSKEETYLWKTFSVLKSTGIVTGTKKTKQVLGEGDFDGKIEIDSKIYNLILKNDVNSDDMLGQQVYYYLQYEKGSQDITNAEIIAIGGKKNKNKTLTVMADKIDKADSMTSLSYWDDNDKQIKAKITPNAVFYYNGKRELNLTPEDFPYKNGDIKLIDNNDDDIYEYVLINKYDVYVAGGSAFGIISSKYNDWQIDLNKIDKISVFRRGIEISSDYIGQWNVLKLKMCKDGLSGTIDVLYSEVEGIIDSYYTEDGKEYIEIKGKKYEVSEIYKKACEENNFYAVKLQKGLSGTFITDDENKIYGVKTVSAGKKVYGFAVKANDKTGLSDETELKIYEMYGKMSIRKIAQNAKVNGTVQKTYDGVMPAFKDTAGKFVPQFILYKINEKGEVSELETAVDASLGNGVEGGYNKDKFSLDEYLKWDGVQSPRPKWVYYAWSDSKIRIKEQSPALQGNRISAVEETPMFYIPYDLSEDSKYSFQLAYNNAYKYSTDADIQVFDTVKYDENYNFKKLSAIVVFERKSLGTADNPYSAIGANDSSIIIVKKVKKALDENDEPVLSIEGITFTNVTVGFSGIFTDKVYNVDINGEYGFGSKRAEDLKEGDIIKVGYENPLSPNLKINRFICLASAEFYANPQNYKVFLSSLPSIPLPDWADRGGCNIVGEVIYVSDDEVIVKSRNNKGEDDYFGCYLSNTRTYNYDVNETRIYEGNTTQIQTGNRVMLIVNSSMNIDLAIIVDEGGY